MSVYYVVYFSCMCVGEWKKRNEAQIILPGTLGWCQNNTKLYAEVREIRTYMNIIKVFHG